MASSSISMSMSMNMITPSSLLRSFSSKLPHHHHHHFLPYPISPLHFRFLRLSTHLQIHSLDSSSSSSSSSQSQSIEVLPHSLQHIINLFQAAHEPRSKYQQLMFYANKLNPLDPKYKTQENKVQGCVSQVWVRAYLDPHRNVYYEADSDSVMTKGLAALLVQGLSGQPIPTILKVSPDFVTLLGLQQNLTPSRNNGFLNMLKLMQSKALFLGLEAEKQSENPVSHVGIHDSEPDLNSEVIGVDGSSEVESLDADVGRSENDVDEWVSDLGDGGGLGTRGERIKKVLENELKPVKLEIEDISYQHAGHMGVRGSDGETHFNLSIVCDEFEGKSLVKRHRMIYGLLQDELQSGLHALSITAKAPSELEQE